MKVLWFTSTPSLFSSNKKGYNGCGWISSLEELISTEEEIELGVAFLFDGKSEKKYVGSTTYYPIGAYNSKIKKLKHNLSYSSYDNAEVVKFLEVIDDFKPDIIHVFGSEMSAGLVSKFTKIPVVIHIQGILNPYLNAWYPPNTTKFDYFKYLGFRDLFLKLKTLIFFKHNAQREKEILKNCSFFLGRTEWDFSISNLYSPNSYYFHVDEVLRNEFYNMEKWSPKLENSKYQIITTISKTDYKGFDLILKTAKLLKEISTLDFEWGVFGISEYLFWEKKLGIKSRDMNVKLLGVGSQEKVAERLLLSDLYVHTSYIDNSPNSLCEAQIIGIPLISTSVGGIPTLVQNNETGILVSANDPFYLAHKIIEAQRNPEKMIRIGSKAREVALHRHSKTRILNNLKNAYTNILEVWR
ncbi:glycosyltransferase family 4 protein [Flectobacillus roseus]